MWRGREVPRRHPARPAPCMPAACEVQMNQRVGEEKADHALVRMRFVCGCLNGRVNGWRGVL